MYHITNSDIKKILEEEVQEIIERYSNEPLDKLIYYLHDKDLPSALIADQVKCRKKAPKKFPALSKKNILYESVAFEQSSSEATAFFKKSFMKGSTMIDLTGGLGMDSIILSENFEEVVYCDLNPSLVELFKYNSSLFDKNKFTINNRDSIELLNTFDDKSFDWIYLDPSRREEGRRSVDLQFCSPNVHENYDLLLSKGKEVCIKVSPAYDFTEAQKHFPHLTDYIVLSVKNECKEVLLVLNKETADTNINKRAVLLSETGEVLYEIMSSSPENIPRIISPSVMRYFYEPDAAIIKAQLSSSLEKEQDLFFINKVADFMTSDQLVKEFPGRVFSVIEVLSYKHDSVRKYLKEQSIKKAHVSKRHFLFNVTEIRKQLKIAEGGEDYLFFTKDKDEKPIFIHCRKVA